MKPLHLKIQGLNSFEKEETLNFSTIKPGEIFGIFGKTGSGKTSVLDAIALALYGRLFRYKKSTERSFVNSNSSITNVVFEFELNSAVYTAQRVYKKTNDKVSPTISRLVNKSENLVLADTSKTMDIYVEKLLGLNFDDFSRTIILPQGKFSEFLHLDNLKRREMLERIFNLSQYGEELQNRLKNEESEKQKELAVIKAQLLHLKDVNEENIIKLEKKLGEKQKEIEDLEILLKKYSQGTLILPLREELEKTKILKSRRKLELSEKEERLKVLIIRQKEMGEELEKEKSATEKEISLLNQEQMKLEQNLEKQKEKDNLLKERDRLLENYKKTSKDLENAKEKEQNLKHKKQEILAKIEDLNEKLKSDDSLSFILAKNLKPNEPCPVCGSLNHPHPKHRGSSSMEIIRILDEEEKQKSELNKIETSLESIQREIQNMALKIQDIRTQGTSIKERLKISAPPIERKFKTIEEIHAEIAKLKSCEKERDESLSKLNKETSQNQGQTEGLKNEIQTLEQLVKEQNTKLELAMEQVEITDLTLLKEMAGKERETSEKLKNANQDYGIIKNNIEQMKLSLDNVSKYTAEEKILQEEVDILTDLKKVLSGKKFVEFMSKRHLEYISKEAALKIREITKGRYSLELEDTDFVIKDFYYGTRRPVVSLSGGETFMVSLSLALALSSKIQLGSGADLDFFFLDEGFGTLDTDSLDMVMASLSGLNLTIGLISHVEEMKSTIHKQILIENREGVSKIISAI